MTGKKVKKVPQTLDKIIEGLQGGDSCERTSIILAHNHPSGDVTPSPEDIQVTDNLKKAGKLLDIEVLDHVIVGEQGSFSSLKRMGYC